MIPHVRVRLLLAGGVYADKVMRDDYVLHVGHLLMGTARVWELAGSRRTVVRVPPPCSSPAPASCPVCSASCRRAPSSCENRATLTMVTLPYSPGSSPSPRRPPRRGTPSVRRSPTPSRATTPRASTRSLRSSERAASERSTKRCISTPSKSWLSSRSVSTLRRRARASVGASEHH